MKFFIDKRPYMGKVRGVMRVGFVWAILLVTSLHAKPVKKEPQMSTQQPSGETASVQVLPSNSVWYEVQKKAQDTVVQLFVQTASFNWLQPFKTPHQSRSWGTGFFINNKGYIVTNFHVVDDAVSIKIQIPSLGKERYEVEVMGGSPDRDVALLRLTPEALKSIKEKLKAIPFLSLGDSDKVVRTQELLALGYPLGQEKLKSTQGIVSGRENVWGDSYIQTTAAINNGNSGGPSLNSDGEVIGINTASMSNAQNVGYIIPINDVKTVIDDLYNVRLLRKPLFGAEFNKATDDMTRFLGNPEPGGYYISRVYDDSLFDRAGIQAGDMLYSVDGQRFDKYGETNVVWSEDKIPLSSLKNRFRLNQKIAIEVYRKGKLVKTALSFDLLDPLPIRRMYQHYEKVDYEIIGGMVIMQLTLNHLDLFDDPRPFFAKYKQREHQYAPRLIITHIFHDSQARQARVIREGDIIEEVNGKKVYTLAELRKVVTTDKKFLRVKTEDKKFMVLALEKIIKDEDKLAKRNFYKKSALVEELENL